MYNYKLYKVEYGHHGICIRRIDTTETELATEKG